MRRLPIYGDRTIKLAFEFAVVLSEVAKEVQRDLTPEIITRAEDIFLNEVRTKGLQKTAINFIPLVLASFETDSIIK